MPPTDNQKENGLKKDASFEEDVLLEQCRLGYQAFATSKDNLNKFALAGFSGLMLIVGLAVANASGMIEAIDRNIYFSLILLIIPLLGAVYTMSGLTLLGSCSQAQWWLVYRLRLLAGHSSAIQNENSFFQIFNEHNKVWIGMPKFIRKTETCVLFMHWGIILIMTIFCFYLFVTVTTNVESKVGPKEYVLDKLPFLIPLLVSFLYALFATIWEIAGIISFIKKAKKMKKDFDGGI